MIKVPAGQPVNFIIEMDLNEQISSIIPFKIVGIESVMICSEVISNDIQAYQNSLEILDDIIPDGGEIKVAFSPAHYAVNADLQELAEHDAEGNVASVGGFTNPFEMISVAIMDEKQNEIGIVSVSCLDFPLEQTMEEILTAKINVH